MVSELFILRHGQTEFNAQRRLQGHCNSPLTAQGEAQALAYGNTLKSLAGQLNIAELNDFAIVSSPLGRAMQTATIVAGALGREPGAVSADDRVKEAGLGEWEHGHIPDIHAANPGLADKPGWYLDGPGAEPLESIQARLHDWLKDPATPSRVIVVSHGVTGVVLRALLLGLDNQAMWAQDKPQDAFYYFSQGTLKRIACR